MNESELRPSMLQPGTREAWGLAAVLDRLDPSISVQLLMADGTLLHANQTALAAVGKTLDDIRGLPFEASPWWPADAAEQQQLSAALAAGRCGEGSRFELHSHSPDGQARTAAFSLQPVVDAAGRVAFLVPSACDISEQHEARERIAYLTDHDALTGLPHWHRLRRQGVQAIDPGRAGADPARSLALLCIGMDHFSRINVALGVAAGDEVLRVLARRIQGCLNPGDRLARGHGDEFIVLLEAQASAAEAAEQLALLVIDAVAEPMSIAGSELFVSASVGMAVAAADGADADTLLRNAMVALDHAQGMGCGRFVAYGRSRLEPDPQRLAIAAALRHAIERQELSLVYQPQVELASGQIVGIEALLRWVHPQLGELAPQRFLPIAEEIGLAASIGDWVIHSACASVAAWQQAGLPALRMHVNISVHQLYQSQFAERIDATLRQFGLQPRHLGIEITEGQMLASGGEVVGQLRRLHALGVEITLDDFGTGQSSLACLRRLPIDVVKIDQALVPGIAESHEALAIARAVLAMAHCLGMKVVAEGVENEAQLVLLAANHCDRVQGRHLGAPMSGEAMTRLLHSGRSLVAPRQTGGDARQSLLVVADDAKTLDRIQRQLVSGLSAALHIETCRDLHSALQRMRGTRFDVVLGALNVTSLDGVALISQAKALQPEALRLLVLDPMDLQGVLNDPRQLEVFRYLPRQHLADHLLLHLKAALEHAQRQRANRVLDAAAGGVPYQPTPTEQELRRLEALEPGLTSVRRGPDGEVLMPQTLPTLPGDLWVMPPPAGNGSRHGR